MFQSTEGMSRSYGSARSYDEPVAGVVFLRGINLGKRRVSNAELAAAFETVGFRGARPFQASGNVILAGASDVDDAALEVGLAEVLGWPVDVFFRSAEELARLVDSPFAGQRGPAGGKPQIIFVRRPLDEPTRAALTDVIPAGDRVVVDGRQVHWLPAGGLADAGPLVKKLDRLLGVTTVRTLATVERVTRALPA